MSILWIVFIFLYIKKIKLIFNSRIKIINKLFYKYIFINDWWYWEKIIALKGRDIW